MFFSIGQKKRGKKVELLARPGEEVASSSWLVGCSCCGSRCHHCSCVWSWPPPSPPVVDNGFGLRDPGADGVFFKTVRVLQHQQFFTHRNWCRLKLLKSGGSGSLEQQKIVLDSFLGLGLSAQAFPPARKFNDYCLPP